MENPLVFLSAVFALGIAAQWLAWRLQMPSILLLLAFGFMMGYFGNADPDELIGSKMLFPVVSLAVAVILFEGGLTLQLRELENFSGVVLRLVTIGVIASWGLGAVACLLLLGTDPRVAALTGAVLTVTGPTVVIPLLRHVRPARLVGSIIKWEGIVIDPVGAVLAALVFEAVIDGGDASHIAMSLIKTIAIGLASGFLSAHALLYLMRLYLIPDFLHIPVSLTAAIGVFCVGNQLAHEAGLVAVTVMGITMANQKRVSVRHLIEFKENLRVLLISCLFIVLAARIEPDDIWQLGIGGFAFLLVLIFVVRPLSVMVSTIGSGLRLKERIFISFLAPRGIVAAAVSSVFALEIEERFAASERFEGADLLVPITFLVIVGTVAVYGIAAAPLARWLGLATKSPQGLLFAGAADWTRSVAKAIHEEGIPVLMVDTNYRKVSESRMAGVPAKCASIISEYVSEEMDLGGIGRLLAMTPNDDLNSLAVIEFAPIFGRAEVYQLSTGNGGSKRDTASSHIRGRYLFQPGLSYRDLESRFLAGAQVKKTRITQEFDYGKFIQRYGDEAVVLFVITELKRLRINATDEPVTPVPGETVIALVGADSAAA